MSLHADGLSWVVLTMGDRPRQLRAAIESIELMADRPTDVIVVLNGPDQRLELPDHVRVVVAGRNLGVPGGRDLGLRLATKDFVGFLDDDAVLMCPSSKLVAPFLRNRSVCVTALRVVDEDGRTARRHVPRPGRSSESRSGPVATFLGGACVVRRGAYLEVGGYFTELMYGHEEVELSWRLVDGGWSIEYSAECLVHHPRTEIGRHADGWSLTGRNRVLIARRTLPVPVMAVHVLVWLVIGAVRAPGREMKRAYVSGWLGGWRHPVKRQPISFRTVGRLSVLGRPPVI